MTTEEIRLICELPNYNSFQDASLYLPYSQAAITKYVNNVEEELGVKLFLRSNKSRKLELTEQGKKLIDSFRRIDEDCNYLKKQVAVLIDSESKRLKMGSQSRIGNLHEQKIISSFIFDNPSVQVSIAKAPADELIRSLISGRLDVAIITFNKSIALENYFGDEGSKLEIKFLIEENEMYAGIAENFYKGPDSVNLKKLENYTFVFPFPDANDIQSAKAAQSWKEIAKEKGMNLKYKNLQGYDDMVFEMAKKQKIAITSTHIPSAQYDGIRFVKIKDWTGGTDLYLLKRKDNNSHMIKSFESCVEKYIQSL